MSRLGIDGFDVLVPEEIPKPGTVLLLGPPTEEKDQLAAQFILEGLQNTDAAILLASEAGLRDLARRLGNMGFDAESAIAEGRLISLEWMHAAAPKNGGPAGLDAVKAALSGAAAAKTLPSLRIVVDLCVTLPESLSALPLDDLSRGIAELARVLGALSLLVVPRAHGVAPALVEAVDIVLDLRPLKPSGFGLAVIAIGGTPLPRSHLDLISNGGRLALEISGKAVGPDADIECPVCKSIIPAGAAVCPTCQSPRPVRQPGESEVLDYIEALGRRVGRPGAPLEPSAPEPIPPETTVPPPAPEKEGPPPLPEPTRRGLTNGLAGTRKSGLPIAPEGRVNGLARTNGLTNGLGRTNGLTNGLGHTNGLTNGLVTLRRGLTNGLTNGNGFTNGLGARRFRSESQRRVWRVYLIPIIAASLLAFPFFFPDLASRNVSGIDGVFGDWTRSDIAPLSTDPALPGSIDLVEAGVRMTPDRLFGYVETRGPLLRGSPDGLETDAIRMFIDADGDAASGYLANDLGADTLIEIMGTRGAFVTASAYTFSGRDSANWSSWSPGGEVLTAVGRTEANRIEFAIESSILLPRDGDGSALRASFEAFSYDGREDTSDFAISPGRRALIVEQRSIAPVDLIAADDLLELHLRAPIGDVSVRSIRIAATGTLPTSSLETAVLHDASKIPLATAQPSDGSFTFNLGPSLTVGVAGTTLRVSAEASATAPGTLGLVITTDRDVDAPNATVSLSSVATDRDVSYVGPVPSGIVIDGGFEDWPLPALDATGEPTTRGNEAIDIAAYDSLRSGNAVAVYARVVGGLFHGGLVPVTNRRNQPPEHAAASLAGVPRSLRGDDTLRVFIDSDGASSTGYGVSVGADWLVEIVGRHGVARTSKLLRFSGSTPGAWSWTPSGDLDFALGTRQIELLASLPSAPVTGARVVIDLRDWRGGSDLAGGATRSATRSPDGASLDEGDYSVVLPMDLRSSEVFRVTTDRFSVSWNLAEIASGEGLDMVALPLSAAPLVMAGSYASYEMHVGNTPAFMRYAFGPGAFKEELVLLAPPSATLDVFSIRFSLTLSGGASLLGPSDSLATRTSGGTGDYEIVVEGETAARFPAPFAMDAASRVTECWYDTAMAGRLDTVCPAAALAAAEYPVRIDPSTTFTLSNNGPNSQAGENMGWSVAAGDLNADGYVDVLTGAPLNDKDAVDAGLAYIYFGPFNASSSSPNVNLKGNGTTNYDMGYGAAIGDLNNDGIDDAVVGQQNGGPTLIFYGRASWPGTVTTANVTVPLPSSETDGSFGTSFAAGNFDGSGGADLVIGRPAYPDISNANGRAYVYFSPFNSYEPTPDLTLAPFNNTKGHFGMSMASGQIDSDTKDDLIVGETTVTAGINTFGRISLFKGSSLTGSGTKTPDKTIIHTTAGSQFGRAVAVGRLNGDTYSDVLAGAPFLSSSNGAAYIYLAKSDGTGLDTNQTASVTVGSQSAGEKFGFSVLIADVYGDGTADAVVGAEASSSNTGRVYVFNNPLSDQTVDETLTGQAGERFGHALAGGRKANDPRFVLVIGGPFWDDTGENDAGRATVATIPEFSDAGLAAGLAVIVLLVLRRRRGHHRRESSDVWF